MVAGVGARCRAARPGGADGRGVEPGRRRRGRERRAAVRPARPLRRRVDPPPPHRHARRAGAAGAHATGVHSTDPRRAGPHGRGARSTASSLPAGVTSGAFRRLVRARGPVARFAAPSLVDRPGGSPRSPPTPADLTRSYVRPVPQPRRHRRASPLAARGVIGPSWCRTPGVSPATTARCSTARGQPLGQAVGDRRAGRGGRSSDLDPGAASGRRPAPPRCCRALLLALPTPELDRGRREAAEVARTLAQPARRRRRRPPTTGCCPAHVVDRVRLDGPGGHAESAATGADRLDLRRRQRRDRHPRRHEVTFSRRAVCRRPGQQARRHARSCSLRRSSTRRCRAATRSTSSRRTAIHRSRSRARRTRILAHRGRTRVRRSRRIHTRGRRGRTRVRRSRRIHTRGRRGRTLARRCPARRCPARKRPARNLDPRSRTPVRSIPEPATP